MYTAIFNLRFDPFLNPIRHDQPFLSGSASLLNQRLNFALRAKSFVLISANPGIGKTFFIHHWTKSLDPNLFLPAYLSLSTCTSLDFFKQLCYTLQLIPKHRKIDMFQQIQSKIISDYKIKKITSIIIIDDAHYLKSDILFELPLIFNFSNADTNPALIILLTHPFFSDKLKMAAFQPLKSRFSLVYDLLPLSTEETFTYIKTALKSATAQDSIFSDSAIKAIFELSNGFLRTINTLASNALIAAAAKAKSSVSPEEIEDAAHEIALI